VGPWGPVVVLEWVLGARVVLVVRVVVARVVFVARWLLPTSSSLFVLGVRVIILEWVVGAHVVFVARVVVARVLSVRGRRRAVALWPRRYGGAGAL